MIRTFSKFYYGFQVTQDERFISIDEGGGEILVEVAIGDYDSQELAIAIQTALNASGANTYTVAFDRNLRKYTISADASFDILIASSSALGQSIYTIIGFTGADLTGLSSYTGDSDAGLEYQPQFLLQDYVPSDIFKRSASSTVNKTAKGTVEVVRFGIEKFIELNIKFITDLPMDGKVVKNNPNGLADAISFFDNITEKVKFEFMPDENDVDTFQTVLLESYPGFTDGTGYKLRELFAQNLPDYYETGLMRLRVIE